MSGRVAAAGVLSWKVGARGEKDGARDCEGKGGRCGVLQWEIESRGAEEPDSELLRKKERRGGGLT